VIEMMTATRLGHPGLQGWRAKLVDGIADPVADRTGLTEDHVRALLGAAFFALAVMCVAGTIRRLAQQAR
jgi:hypothetical protein